MDERTKELFETWEKNKTLKTGTYWPILQIETYERYKYSNKKCDYLKLYFEYYNQRSYEYAEAYRILAYCIYGYGNWSNNQRRRNNLFSLKNK